MALLGAHWNLLGCFVNTDALAPLPESLLGLVRVVVSPNVPPGLRTPTLVAQPDLLKPEGNRLGKGTGCAWQISPLSTPV